MIGLILAQLGLCREQLASGAIDLLPAKTPTMSQDDSS